MTEGRDYSTNRFPQEAAIAHAMRERKENKIIVTKFGGANEYKI